MDGDCEHLGGREVNSDAKGGLWRIKRAAFFGARVGKYGCGVAAVGGIAPARFKDCGAELGAGEEAHAADAVGFVELVEEFLGDLGGQYDAERCKKRRQ